MRKGLWSCLLACVLLACNGVEAPAPVPDAATGGQVSGLTPPFDLGAGYPVARVEPASTAYRHQEGEPIPHFALAFADGTALETADLRGRALLINFWATWCGPCRHEIPLLLAKQEAHPEELLVLAVNVREDRDKVEEFAREFAMHVPIVLDAEGDVTDLFQTRGLPTTLFVDAEGDLVATWLGVLDEAKLTELVNASLR